MLLFTRNKIFFNKEVKLLTFQSSDLGMPPKHNYHYTCFFFADRKTPVGAVLNGFLSKEINIPPEAAHLLFSANRWECKESIEKTLMSGTTLVIDRYASSGAAYTAANTGRCLKWCQQPDIGLPKPDCVVFLKVSKCQQELRNNWGEERFENDEIQARVDANYEKLRDNTWIIVDANREQSLIHNEILEKVLLVIREAQLRQIELLGS